MNGFAYLNFRLEPDILDRCRRFVVNTDVAREVLPQKDAAKIQGELENLRHIKGDQVLISKNREWWGAVQGIIWNIQRLKVVSPLICKRWPRQAHDLEIELVDILQ